MFLFAEPTVERGRTISRISVAKGSNLNFRGRKSNSLMNLCGKVNSNVLIKYIYSSSKNICLFFFQLSSPIKFVSKCCVCESIKRVCGNFERIEIIVLWENYTQHNQSVEFVFVFILIYYILSAKRSILF